MIMYLEVEILFAMKIIVKKNVPTKKEKEYIKNEKLILQTLDNEFIVKLHYSFQDATNLYLVKKYTITIDR